MGVADRKAIDLTQPVDISVPPIGERLIVNGTKDCHICNGFSKQALRPDARIFTDSAQKVCRDSR
jgi:hypothetical protein